MRCQLVIWIVFVRFCLQAFLQVLVRKWHSLKSVAQRIQLLDKLARLHECRIWALQRTCKNVECWMKSRPSWWSRGIVEDGCMFTVQPHVALAAHSNTWTRKGNRLRQTETGIPSLDQLRRIWLLEIRGRLNFQSIIRYGRDLRRKEFWSVVVSIMMPRWHCVRQDWSMMREHQLESVWNSLQHLLALRIYSRESLGPVHADTMRNSTPSIGIAQAITARRWQRPFWQRRGPPEGNLADRVCCIFMLEFMWSKHKELRLHFLWNVLSWPINLYLLRCFLCFCVFEWDFADFQGKLMRAWSSFICVRRLGKI